MSKNDTVAETQETMRKALLKLTEKLTKNGERIENAAISCAYGGHVYTVIAGNNPVGLFSIAASTAISAYRHGIDDLQKIDAYIEDIGKAIGSVYLAEE